MRLVTFDTPLPVPKPRVRKISDAKQRANARYYAKNRKHLLKRERERYWARMGK